MCSGMSVSVAWFRRSWYDLPISVNQLVNSGYRLDAVRDDEPADGPDDDALQPESGEGRAGVVPGLDEHGPFEDPKGLHRVRGGRHRTLAARRDACHRRVGADRTINVACENADPNLRYNCDQSQFDVPLRSDFKFIGTYRSASASSWERCYRAMQGAAVPVSWSVPASVYPGRQTHGGPHLVDDGRGDRLYGIESQRSRDDVSAPLEPAGFQHPARLQSGTLRGWKPGHVQCDELQRRVEPEPGLRASLGAPTSILQPRLFRISSTLKF